MPLVLARYSTLRTMEYFRVPRDMTLRTGDMVVLKTRRGTEMGQVKSPIGDPELGPKDSVGGEVLRRGTIEDANKFREGKFRDVKPLRRMFKALAAKHKLNARFEASEELLGGEKLVIYFSSEDRIDFRDLVKDLTDQTSQRIELRQVGARDAARVTGDVGVCGQELCCISYIIDFVPVSMKMAKSQRISLDPAKISGQCGRLKCCLKYEDDLYNELKQNVPQEGQPVVCDGKDCHACNVDILGQKVVVDFGDGTREERPLTEIQFEAGWSEKDIRRYRKERRATIRAEKEARLAEKQARADRRNQPRPESPERRQEQQPEHPARRVVDEPADEPVDEPAEDEAPDETDYTAAESAIEPESDDGADEMDEPEAAGPAQSGPQQASGQPRPEGDRPRRRRRGRRRGRRREGEGGPPPAQPPSA
jgi:cell fate regulator YaaT (PSP1 superfamily)